MRCYIFRHAPTDWNAERKYIGATDRPLSPEGISAAQKLGVNKSVGRVYTSGMLRANQTAAIWFPNAQIIPLSRLAEMNFGSFEGRTYENLQHDIYYINWLNSKGESPSPGGESKSEFTERVLKCFDEIIAAQQAILVVHGGTIMSIMGEYARPHRPYNEWNIRHCGGYFLDTESGEYHESEAPRCILQSL